MVLSTLIGGGGQQSGLHQEYIQDIHASIVMTQPGGLGYTDTHCSPKFGKNQSLCIKCQQKLLQVLITLLASRRDFTTI